MTGPVYPGGMKMVTTVRNCLPVFRLVCPQRWERLAPTDDPAVRHCSQCDRPVHYCESDAETVARAQAGDCIAREMPDLSELRRVYVGRPREVPTETPVQAEARQLMLRERGIDDSIKNAASSTRSCPRCSYTAPDWRVACRVCGFEFGRILQDEPTPN